MKKLLILTCALALTLSMNISAFAAEEAASGSDVTIQETSGSTTTDGLNRLEERKAEFEQKKADNAEFREAVKAERDTVKANRENNKALREENRALRKNLKEELNALKDSGVTLDAGVAEELKELTAELKSVTGELKGTKGDIKEIADQKKESIKSRDYEAMRAAFAEIGEIQSSRNANLIRINEILKEMIDLLP